MVNRLGLSGNGHSKGLIDVQPISAGCVLLTPNVQKPPPDDELPFALAQVLQKWMAAEPVRVREMLPITNAGRTIGIFVWFDPIGR
jgi:hypothetical protein